jgi:3-oxoacyl-[acyl-carrier protein] reductase
VITNNQGLGEAIATAYVVAGANVFLCARDEAKLAEVQTRLKALAGPGQQVEAIRADVSKGQDVARLASATLTRSPGPTCKYDCLCPKAMKSGLG